jgi:DNA-binding MarR family transcriptional regulator
MLLFIELSNNGVDEATTAVLSERSHHSKPAVSQMINVLEKKGYVTREICKNDRRLTRILLTDLGYKVLEQEKRVFLGKIDHALDRMGKEDSEAFIGLLEKYFEIIKDLHKDNT